MDYFLPEHVHCCVDESWCVFLDLAKDQYRCAPRERLEARDPGLLRQLLALGLLTGDSHGARPICSAQIASPTASFRESQRGEVHEPGWRPSALRLSQFVRACVSADLQLRRSPLRRAVERIARFKSGANHEFDWSRALDRAAYFRKRRPWYPRDALCLFDSLALLEFLAAGGLVADWVFGVRAEPFEAHCWVQRERVVLNDSVERVCGFVPIMSV